MGDFLSLGLKLAYPEYYEEMQEREKNTFDLEKQKYYYNLQTQQAQQQQTLLIAGLGIAAILLLK